MSRRRVDDLQVFEEKFQEILYLFTSCGMTLVDQSRAINKKVDLSDYKDKLSSIFSDNCHRMIQELRIDLVHVKLHQPSWQLSISVDRANISRFVLKPTQLRRRIDEYHGQAKQYLHEHPDGIDLGELIYSYRNQVNEFQEWLQVSLNKSVGQEIEDYLRAERILNATGARCWWKMILSQVLIAGKRDPYQYLDQYLTQLEIEEIQSLPRNSKKQGIYSV